MRTRIYNKMTAQEVEDYLARGGDTIFIAMGVVEVHGECPIDVETVWPEAVAIELAEEADGVAMINLPYFYPGGTVISNSTVHFTILDSIEYLMKICHSLADQGFKRFYLINGHGPSQLTANAVAREFFDERRLHICNMGIMNMQIKAFETGKSKNFPFGGGEENFMEYGAYKILNQLDYIPVDPNATEERGAHMATEPALTNFMKLYTEFAGYGVTAQIFSDPKQHGGGRIFKSREELEAAAEKGVQQIKDLVKSVGIRELNEALKDYQEYVQEVVEAYPRVRPVK